jgi:hypothetical protein
LGDYSGLDFYAGTLHPLWFDNSNSTGDNPNGTLRALNAYTANVPSSAFAAGGQISLGGTAAVAGPSAALSFAGNANVGYAIKGNTYTITVRYADPTGINRASIAGSNLLITGPNGFSASPQHVRLRPQGRAVLATYTLANPAGSWATADNGIYSIVLQPGQVLNGAGTASSGGILGSFAVSIHGATHRLGGGTGFRGSGRD